MRSSFTDGFGAFTCLQAAVGEEYRRFTDDRIFVVDNPTQLPCDGPADCMYERLTGGAGEYITVRPKGAASSSDMGVTPTGGYQPTEAAATRSFKDVAVETAAMVLMTGGAMAAGYGLGSKRPGVAALGALAVVLGAGTRLAVLIPFLQRLTLTRVV